MTSPAIVVPDARVVIQDPDARGRADIVVTVTSVGGSCFRWRDADGRTGWDYTARARTAPRLEGE